MIYRTQRVPVPVPALAENKGDATRYPADAELREAFRTKPIYLMIGRKERLADMLWDLECAARTKYNVNTPRPDFLSVEHILPQTWRGNWALPDGRLAASESGTPHDEKMAAAISSREAALHRFGNLTLITMPGNATASNRPFTEKKPWLSQSLLALNLAIADHTIWDEEAIRQRGETLADLAVKAWPALELTQKPALAAAE